MASAAAGPWRNWDVAKLQLPDLVLLKADPACLVGWKGQVGMFQSMIYKNIHGGISILAAWVFRTLQNSKLNSSYSAFPNPALKPDWAMKPEVDLALRRMAKLGFPKSLDQNKPSCSSQWCIRLLYFRIDDDLCCVIAWNYFAKEFLRIIVLVTFLSVPTWDTEANKDLDIVEFFSGRARVSRLASWSGLKVRSYDISYVPASGIPGDFKRGAQIRAPMDINGSAGFASLGFANTLCKYVFFIGQVSINHHMLFSTRPFELFSEMDFHDCFDKLAFPQTCSLHFKWIDAIIVCANPEACSDTLPLWASAGSPVHHCGGMQLMVGCKPTH